MRMWVRRCTQALVEQVQALLVIADVLAFNFFLMNVF